jgi:hypothetical protein
MTKKRKRITAREFSSRFTKIVSRHLSALPTGEQERRIKNAARTALGASRAEHPTSCRVEETRAIPLLSRSRE